MTKTSPKKSRIRHQLDLLAMFSLTVLPRGTLSTALCLLLLRLSRRRSRLQRGLWALLPFLAGAHEPRRWGMGPSEMIIPSGYLTYPLVI